MVAVLNLTLTSVVFEFFHFIPPLVASLYLTLTSVVFEYYDWVGLFTP